MSNNPVTEARMLEILNELKSDLKIKFDSIYSELKEIKGFQRHEADAIEFELDSVLKKYLKKTYFRMNIEKFPIKKINDPYTHEELTDFDAAFLLSPLKHEIDYKRLAAASITLPSKKNQIKEGYTFILAEAKHHINREKIQKKLWQFDRIMNIFNLVKRMKNGSSNCAGVHKKFMATVQRNQYLAAIDSCVLFFGAAYWQKGLLYAFEEDVAEYSRLVDAFNAAGEDSNKKTAIYRRLSAIEMKWYEVDKVPHSTALTSNEILKIQQIDGAMNHVKFIQPSGERYTVTAVGEPVGITPLSIGAGSLKKTRRRVL